MFGRDASLNKLFDENGSGERISKRDLLRIIILSVRSRIVSRCNL